MSFATTWSRAYVQDIFDHQDLTAEDVERLNSSRAKLDEQIMATLTRKGEAEKRAWKMEIARDKALKELEEAVEAFNSQIAELLLQPTVARRARQERLYVRVDASSDHLLSCDMRGVVQPLLREIIESIDRDATSASTEATVAQEDIVRLGEATSEKQDECGEARRRVAMLEQQYALDKEVCCLSGYPCHAILLDSFIEITGLPLHAHRRHGRRSRASRQTSSSSCRLRLYRPARTSPMLKETRPGPSTAFAKSTFPLCIPMDWL
jgi:hypothetical protein